ncbi:MAG: hypothetical protein IJ735_01145 [Clostridia bacterium]|nr:hypothetical protein [Clostridia bacterium]
MTYENLTNFDKYVLAQSDRSTRRFADFGAPETVPAPERGAVDEKDDLYEKYMINELRRTTPSSRPFMTKEEFFADLNGQTTASAVVAPTYPTQDFRASAFSYVPTYTYETADTQATTTVEEKKVRKNKFFSKIKLPKLTRMGKIILAVYGIIIVALASILIVSNTSVTDVNFNESANASQAVEEEQNPSVIRAISIQEEGETHDDWFDKLCDALNK